MVDTISPCRRRTALLAFCILSLAGCGGGGGGSGGVATSTGSTSTSASPAQSAPIANPNSQMNFQSVSSTATYQAASASGSINGPEATLAAPSPNATVTVTTDAAGNLSGITFNMSGIRVTPPVAGFISVNKIDAAQISSILSDNSYGHSVGYTLSEVAAGQLLNSSAYGAWIDSNSKGIWTFAIGNLTPQTSVPTSGSAIFNGFTLGTSTTSSGGTSPTIDAFQGNAQIIANFANQTVTTNFTNIAVKTDPYAVPFPNITGLPDLTGTSAMTGNAYAGTISGGGLSGTVNGNFYGAAAQETAGVWKASGNGSTWLGSFGAK